jgi:hypothetical protein
MRVSEAPERMAACVAIAGGRVDEFQRLRRRMKMPPKKVG